MGADNSKKIESLETSTNNIESKLTELKNNNKELNVLWEELQIKQNELKNKQENKEDENKEDNKKDDEYLNLLNKLNEYQTKLQKLNTEDIKFSDIKISDLKGLNKIEQENNSKLDKLYNYYKEQKQE